MTESFSQTQKQLVNESPLISVIVPAFNAATYLNATLESIRSQQGPFSTEVIVVDDGSTDDTAEQAAQLPDVRLIRQSNAGPSAARNRGIAESRGHLIAFLDADDLWTPTALASLLTLLRSHPQAGLAFGNCRRFSDCGSAPLTQFQEQGLGADFFGGQSLVTNPYAKLFCVNYIPTGAVLARKDCIQTVGGFDSTRRLVEDLDLWLRIAMHCPMVYTEAVCELKRTHVGNVSTDLESMTLAYIDLIETQQQRYQSKLRRQGIKVGPRLALEHCLVGDRREQRDDHHGARQSYFSAFRAHPSLRPIYYWLRTLLPHR